MPSDEAPFRCPACRARLDVGRVRPGARMRCPKCGATFTREAPGTASAAASTEATSPTTARAGPPPGEALTERDLDRIEPNATRMAVPSGKVARRSLPARIGRFRLERELGRGGMGVVFLADDEKLRRKVAVKLLETLGDVPDQVERFLREARSVARLRHPGIVQVYDIDEWEGRPYFTMEYVDGAGLDRILREPGEFGFQRSRTGMDPHEAAEMVRQAAEAVEHAHRSGVVHRDLKPANILVALPERAAKVADFGLAKDVSLSPSDVSRMARLTRTGMMFGTPGYMSPEQAGGRLDEVGPASDVWALGVVLFESLTGRLPFEGKSPGEILAGILTREAPAARSLRPTLPRDLDTVCAKALGREPADRYPSAGELAQDLGRWLAGEPIVGRPRPGGGAVRWMRRHLAALGVAAAGVAIGVAGTVWLAHDLQARHQAEADAARAQEEAARLEVERRAEAAQAAAAQALFRQGQQLEELGRRREALGAYHELVEKYPAAAEAAPAQARISALETRTLGPRETELMRRVEEQKVTFSFTDAPLDDIVAFLREFTGLNLLVDPESRVNEEYAGQQCRLTLRMDDVKMASTLRRMLEPHELVLVPKGDVLVITNDDRYDQIAGARIVPPGPEAPAEDRALAARLGEVKVDIDFTDAGIADVFDFLREYAKVNVATEGEVDLDHTITFRLLAVTVGELLELLGGIYDWQVSVRDEAVVLAERK